MNEKKYEPQPGTTPHKVIEYLKGCPARSWVASVVICEAIGHPSIVGLGSFLGAAMKAGAVKLEKRHNKSFWALGDGVPVEQPKIAGEKDDDPIVQRVVPVSAFQGVNMDRVHELTAAPKRVKAAPPQAEPQPEPSPAQPEPAPFGPRFALWSDGILQIEHGTAVIKLHPEAAQQLRRFLTAMPGSES